jgi:hypothetical protein
LIRGCKCRLKSCWGKGFEAGFFEGEKTFFVADFCISWDRLLPQFIPIAIGTRFRVPNSDFQRIAGRSGIPSLSGKMLLTYRFKL